MKVLSSMFLMTVVVSGCVQAKGLNRFAPQQQSVASREVLPVMPQARPKVEKKLSREAYARNQTAALSGNIIDDILPKKSTIERLVNEFKDEYPGPDKAGDTKILYEAIIKNPEIKKHITLENATRIYKFVRETISSAWDKQEELIWSR